MSAYDPYAPPGTERTPTASAGPAGFKRSIVGNLAIVAIGVGVAAQTLEALASLADPATVAPLTPVLSGIGSVGRIVGVVAFLVWIHRIVANAVAFGGHGLTLTPSRAVLFWFVPLFNLVHGYRAVTQAWAASDPDLADARRGWLPRGGSGNIILHWWLAYIASRVAVLATRKAWTPTVYAICVVAELVAYVLMVLVVRRLDERQRECASRLAEAG
jgi:hypothetical protein